MKFDLYPLGDDAVVIELGEKIDINIHERVKTISALLDRYPFDWMIEYVPSFATVTVFYDPVKVIETENNSNNLPYDTVCFQIHNALTGITKEIDSEPRIVDIPVCYGGELGPDLTAVAAHNQLTTEDVIDIHTSGEYTVYMVGFAPGFPYIGGMSSKIVTPRRSTPRLKIPAGSVGIAGEQTGVYPIETPGGWQLIGRTPIKLFQASKESPSYVQAGDKIRFHAITRAAYDQWGNGV